MTKTISVTAGFIRKGHKASCREWKEKLEAKFPEVFVTGTSTTIKRGSKITITASSDTFMIASIDSSRTCLINLKSGNRWATPITVSDMNSITVAELAKMSDSSVSEVEKSFTIDGQPYKTVSALSDRATVQVEPAFITEAYRVCPDTTLAKEIKSKYPQAFKAQYVNLTKSGSLSLSRTWTTIEPGVKMIIGAGMAPKPEMSDACIIIEGAVDIEILNPGTTRQTIAFKNRA